MLSWPHRFLQMIWAISHRSKALSLSPWQSGGVGRSTVGSRGAWISEPVSQDLLPRLCFHWCAQKSISEGTKASQKGLIKAVGLVTKSNPLQPENQPTLIFGKYKNPNRVPCFHFHEVKAFCFRCWDFLRQPHSEIFQQPKSCFTRHLHIWTDTLWIIAGQLQFGKFFSTPEFG